LLREIRDKVAVEDQAAEVGGRADGVYGRQPAVLAMKAQQVIQVDVADAVAVGEHESLAIERGLESLDPSAGVGPQAGVDEVHGPGPGLGLVEAGLSDGKVDGQVGAEAVI